MYKEKIASKSSEDFLYKEAKEIFTALIDNTEEGK